MSNLSSGMLCPRCGGATFKRAGSILSPRGRVQRYECRECGKKQHPSLKTQPIELREGFLDIEASQLKGNFGHTISWAIKDRGGRVHSDVLKHHSLNDEKRILRSLLRQLKQYDLVYTYYGTGFDIPFLRTRCLYHKLPFPEYMTLYHRDVYFMARGRLSLHSKRLEAVAEFLGITDKTRLDPAIWVAAGFGDKDAYDYIHEHNVADVEVLEKVHEILEPFYLGTRRSI